MEGTVSFTCLDSVVSYIRVQHQPRSEKTLTSHVCPVSSLTPAVEGQSKQAH